MKPRLRKYPDGRWLSFCEHLRVLGETPEEAYEHWNWRKSLHTVETR